MIRHALMLTAGVLTAGIMVCGSARADPTTTVGGWTVHLKPQDNGSCNAVYNYDDPDDDNKKNVIVFSSFTAKSGATSLIFSLFYQGWKWKKGSKVTTDLSVDGKRVAKDISWQGDDQTLTMYQENANNLITALAGGKTIVLKFDDGDKANFVTPNAGMALGALALCLSEK